MKKAKFNYFRALVFLLLFFILFFFPKLTKAGDEACTVPGYPTCYAQRVMNEYNCSGCSDYHKMCINSAGNRVSDEICKSESECFARDPDYPTCTRHCNIGGSYFLNSCRATETIILICKTDSGKCGYTYNGYVSCDTQSTTGTCTETPENKFFSCCGGDTPPTDPIGGGGDCTSTAPSNLSVAYTSPTSAVLTWDHGVNGVWQRLFVGESLDDVKDLCRRPYSCLVYKWELLPELTIYKTGKILDPNASYWWKLDTYENDSCVESAYITSTYSAPSCPATAPTNLSVTHESDTKATLTWTHGTGGVIQKIYVGANKGVVEGRCVDLGCVVKAENVGVNQESYTTANVLASGTIYYWIVENYKDVNCKADSLTKIYLSSCNSNSPNLFIIVGNSAPLTVAVNSSPEIESVRFTSANTGVAGVNPAVDTTHPYGTTVTGVATGATTVTHNVMSGVVSICSSISNVTVTSVNPWWQVKDSDLITNGNIKSSVPTGKVLSDNGPGGYPGVAIFGGSLTPDPSTGKLSSKVRCVQDATFFNHSLCCFR
jgi:hypothetical protein